MSPYRSTRQPSAKYLPAQSIFLEVNGSREKRLQSYRSNQKYNKSHDFQLSQELEADLSFYCESQREVDRLLDELNALKMRLLMLEMEAKIDRSIIQDFIKSKELDMELATYFVEQLKPNLNKSITRAA